MRDLLRAREHYAGRYRDPVLAAMTNGRFSLAASNLAQEHGVELFDGDRIGVLGTGLYRLVRVRTAG